MHATLQRLLTHCTAEERREVIRIYIWRRIFDDRELIGFELSDVIFNQDTRRIEDCKINGVEAPANIEALNILITEEMTNWDKYDRGGFLVDIELFDPSSEYLKDLYFFEHIEEVF